MIHWLKARTTIFIKLIIMCLLVISPLYALGLFVNDLGEKSVSQEISKSQFSLVEYHLRSLISEVERMMLLQKEYIVDRDLQRLVYGEAIMDHYEWSQRVLTIQKMLRLMKNSSIYLEEVSVYIPRSHILLSSTASIQSIPSEQMGAFSSMFNTMDKPLTYWNGRLLINLDYPPAYLFRQEKAYIVSMELSLPELRQSLQRMVSYQHSGAMIVDIDKQWSIASDEGHRMTSHLLEYSFNEAIVADQPQIDTIKVEDTEYLITFQQSPLLQAVLVIYVPQDEVFGQLNTYRGLFWLLSLLSLFIIIVFSYWIYRKIHQPLMQLVKAFHKVERGKRELIHSQPNQNEFSYLYKQFNAMVSELNILIHEVYEQQLREQSTKLKQLQSQINPHFLYNTYYILYRLARSQDLDSITAFCKHLGEYFQYITRSASDYASLVKEVNHTRAYLEIQTIRFADRIRVEIDRLPGAYHHIRVPRLFIQPIIENAYKHGLENKLFDGLIKIQFIIMNAQLHIVIEDNGEGMGHDALLQMQHRLAVTDEQWETSGLINVHRRIQLMFGTDSGITVAKSQLGGLKVTIRLQINRAKERERKGEK